MAIDATLFAALEEQNARVERLLEQESIADEKDLFDSHALALENVIAQISSLDDEQVAKCKTLILTAHNLLMRSQEKAEREKQQIVDSIVKIKKTKSTQKRLESIKSLKEI